MAHNTDNDAGHAWAETRDRFPTDQLLRDSGWVLVDRPSVGEAVWRKGKDGPPTPEHVALWEAWEDKKKKDRLRGGL